MTASKTVLHAFYGLFSDKKIDFENVGRDLPLPSFPLQLIQDLLSQAEDMLSHLESNVIKLSGNIYIVGDLHGNIRDLIRILATASPPPESRFLFLGDYVDRGEYSLEVIVLLLALAIEYPDSVYLLRGNHEYESINSTYGFKEQVFALYGNSLVYERFNRVFSYLQIAAIVSETNLCVHGGLSPQFHSLHQLDEIDRTLDPPCALVNDIIWSDPSNVTDGCIQSTRGNGCMFGHAFLVQFLTNNNLTRIIRAHECVKNGVRIGKDSKIITVFSTCNYKGEGSNQCGLLKILEDGSFQAFNLQTISILHREEANFRKISYQEKKSMPNCMIMSSPSSSNLIQAVKLSSRSSSGLPHCGSMMRVKAGGSIRRIPSHLLLCRSDSTKADHNPKIQSCSSTFGIDKLNSASILCNDSPFEENDGPPSCISLQETDPSTKTLLPKLNPDSMTMNRNWRHSYCAANLT